MMTKKEMFEKLIEVVNASEESPEVKDGIILKLENEIELLSKKKNPTKKEQQKREENERISENVLDAMERVNDWMTCNEIMESAEVKEIIAELAIEKFSIQRLTSILKGLIAENYIEKEKGKKKMVYKIITDKPIEGEEVPDNEEEQEIKDIVEEAQIEENAE